MKSTAQLIPTRENCRARSAINCWFNWQRTGRSTSLNPTMRWPLNLYKIRFRGIFSYLKHGKTFRDKKNYQLHNLHSFWNEICLEVSLAKLTSLVNPSPRHSAPILLLGKCQFSMFSNQDRERCIGALKTVTKRYAAQQEKYIKNKFCHSIRPPKLPPVYQLDATDISNWVKKPNPRVTQSEIQNENVRDKAFSGVDEYMCRKSPEISVHKGQKSPGSCLSSLMKFSVNDESICDSIEDYFKRKIGMNVLERCDDCDVTGTVLDYCSKTVFLPTQREDPIKSRESDTRSDEKSYGK